MNTFKSLKVGTRLALGFGTLLLFLAVSSALSLYQLRNLNGIVQSITDDQNLKTDLMVQLRRINLLSERSTRDLLLAPDEDRQAVMENISRLQEQYAQVFSRLSELHFSPQAEASIEQIVSSYGAARQANERIRELAVAGEPGAARALLYGDAEALFNARSDALQSAIDVQQAITREKTAEVDASVTFANRMLVGFGILAGLSGLLMAWLIARSLTIPLGRATGIADRISRGQLDNVIPPQPDDETGRLLSSMHAMQEQLQAVLQAQTLMAQEHDAGRTRHRMDASRFPGDFGRMVHDTNALVDSHLGLLERLSDLMARYAIGDLSQDMPALPEELAVITSTMATVKQNLAAINSEASRLARAAAEGDFSLRGDTDRFQYAFHAMIDSLNQLMRTADGNLSTLSGMLRAIAAGDLTQRMDGDFQGVFARMRDDANATVDQLTRIVGRIQHSSSTINTAAAEIASGNNDLSRRTEQQAANLEETAASMEELTSTVRQNADHARQANQLTIGAASIASEGGKVVDQVVSTMGEIQSSSRRISEIISVIDGIAFQTNILALNAAVEAARAGEQGRGFAVVATEVRALAQRSATAAREIKDLIEDSASRVESGSRLAGEAGRTMTDMVASIQRVTDIMAEISAASQEQAAGIEQVGQTIVQMDQTTQQNAALVEEASAAASAMEEQARQLASAILAFKLEPLAAADVAGIRPQTARQPALTIVT